MEVNAIIEMEIPMPKLLQLKRLAELTERSIQETIETCLFDNLEERSEHLDLDTPLPSERTEAEAESDTTS